VDQDIVELHARRDVSQARSVVYTGQAEHHHRLAQLRLAQAKALVRVREFVSPHEGTVMAILRHPGEPVAANEPVFRVVDTVHLLVIGQVDVADAWRVQAGQSVRVTPEVAGADLAIERETFSGRVAFIDGHVDPETRTSKVIAKIDNRDALLRSGLEVRMEISPPAATGVVPLAVRPGPGPAPDLGGPGRAVKSMR
jgi:multidrug resistance efflux pump